MSRKWGKTKRKKPDGSDKYSQHTEDNTGPRRYLVIEFDDPHKRPFSETADEQAALVMRLAESLPLVMALHSGSKSLHAWFFVQGKSDDDLMPFMRLAVSLGADHSTWSKTQFVRMPNSAHSNGNPQAVWYFNPGNIPF